MGSPSPLQERGKSRRFIATSTTCFLDWAIKITLPETNIAPENGWLDVLLCVKLA